MTFRLRVFLLVVLIAVVATGASAYLTLTLVKREVTRSAEVARDDLNRIVTALTAYGRQHGTWEAVAPLALELAQRTGQRIHLMTEYRQVIVDTAVSYNQPMGPVRSEATLIDARPRLALPAAVSAKTVLVVKELMEQYRQEVRFVACLTRKHLRAKEVVGPYGVPSFQPEPAAPLPDVEACRLNTTSLPKTFTLDEEAVMACSKLPGLAPDAADVGPPGVNPTGVNPTGVVTETQAHRDCLEKAFANRTEQVAPMRLLLNVEPVDATRRTVSLTPIVVAVSAVMVLVVIATLVLSRHVLRPIRRLTIAAQHYGAGDLGERVRVEGNDELARLAWSFNRMADSLQRGEEQQRRMISDVAHELRNPLANLRGYLEALKDGVIAPDAALFRSLHEEALLQQRVVEDLQTLALAESGTLAYHWSVADLGELLETCRAAHQAIAAAAGAELEVVAEPGVYVRADVDRLRQVVGNLVTNAVRYSSAGTIVTLTAAQFGPTATLRVVDHGVGMSEADQQRVFDRFWRADGTRARATGGSGLGLAIARQITVDHGGEITLNSEVGLGTTFTITLPAAQEPA
jgi:two-component system sensor histidine kinase BaeS